MRRTVVARRLVLALARRRRRGRGAKPRLKAFASCKALVDYARAGALRTDGGTGVSPRAAPMPIDASSRRR